MLPNLLSSYLANSGPRAWNELFGGTYTIHVVRGRSYPQYGCGIRFESWCFSDRKLTATNCKTMMTGKSKRRIPNRGIEPRPCRNWSSFDDWERQILATRPIRMEEHAVRSLVFDGERGFWSNISVCVWCWAIRPELIDGQLVFGTFHLPPQPD
jgi:hypothetical protein